MGERLPDLISPLFTQFEAIKKETPCNVCEGSSSYYGSSQYILHTGKTNMLLELYVNYMWILKNRKNVSVNLNRKPFPKSTASKRMTFTRPFLTIN